MAEDTDTQEHRQADQSAPATSPRDMLADACGGAVETSHSSDAWDLDRYAEHIRDRQVEIVALLFRLLPDEAEHLGQPYGDSFDAVEAALHHLGTRSAILDRLVDAGYVTESLVEDIEEIVVADAREREAAKP